MASGLLSSFPTASSSITSTGESCWWSKKYVSNYHASSYATRALWNKTGKLSKEYCIVTSSQHHYKGVGGGSKCDKFERKYFMNATSSQSEEFEPQAHESKSILESIKDVMDVLHIFSRPYALIATGLAIISTSLLAVEKLSDLSPTFFIGLLQYFAAFLGNYMYHVGLNQLADVEIDKINKPYLPLASGVASSRTVAIIVGSFLLSSFGLTWIIGSMPMFWALFASFLLATAYNMNWPLLRWKRFTLLTLVYNITNSIIACNLGPFLHMKTHVLKRAATYPKPLIFAFMMTGLFFAVIALAKDIPDMEGDKAEGIRTLAIRLGPKPVFWISVLLLEMGYGTAIFIGATSPYLWSKIFTVLTHAMMALILWYQAKSVDLGSKSSSQSFYMVIFKLLCAEYILVPFVR